MPSPAAQGVYTPLLTSPPSGSGPTTPFHQDYPPTSPILENALRRIDPVHGRGHRYNAEIDEAGMVIEGEDGYVTLQSKSG